MKTKLLIVTILALAFTPLKAQSTNAAAVMAPVASTVVVQTPGVIFLTPAQAVAWNTAILGMAGITNVAPTNAVQYVAQPYSDGSVKITVTVRTAPLPNHPVAGTTNSGVVVPPGL